MAAVQVPGGIGGDPLHQHLLAFPGLVLAVIVSGVQHKVNEGGQRLLLQAEVQEARAGDGDALRLRQKLAQLLRQRLGDGQGVLAQGAGQLHGRRASVVAKLGVLGRLDQQDALVRVQIVDLFHRLPDGVVQLLFKIAHASFLLWGV